MVTGHLVVSAAAIWVRSTSSRPVQQVVGNVTRVGHLDVYLIKPNVVTQVNCEWLWNVAMAIGNP